VESSRRASSLPEKKKKEGPLLVGVSESCRPGLERLLVAGKKKGGKKGGTSAWEEKKKEKNVAELSRMHREGKGEEEEPSAIKKGKGDTRKSRPVHLETDMEKGREGGTFRSLIGKGETGRAPMGQSASPYLMQEKRRKGRRKGPVMCSDAKEKGERGKKERGERASPHVSAAAWPSGKSYIILFSHEKGGGGDRPSGSEMSSSSSALVYRKKRRKKGPTLLCLGLPSPENIVLCVYREKRGKGEKGGGGTGGGGNPSLH